MCRTGESGILLMGRAAFHYAVSVSGATAMQSRVSHRGDVSHRGERTARGSVTVSFSIISLFFSSLSSHTLSEITDVRSTDVNVALNRRCPVRVFPLWPPLKNTHNRERSKPDKAMAEARVVFFDVEFFFSSQKAKPQRMPDRGKF